MQQRILIPLDGSRLAEMVLPHALAIAQSTASAVTLLRVVPAAGPETDAYLDQVVERARVPGLVVETRVRGGDPAAQIVEYAAHDHSVALIAMATHGRHGLERLVLGSVADQVLHATPTPLLLVRSDPDALCAPTSAAYRTILVPLDGSAFAAQALDQATVLAAATGATLLLVAVVPTCAERELGEAGMVPFWVLEAHQHDAGHITWSLDATALALREQGLHVRTTYAHGIPASEILCVAAREHADLIVIATHARAGLQRLRYGSVALKVLQGTCNPVLMVRGAES